MSKLKLLLSTYIFVVLALFFYSFTQVDLSLTLSKFSIYQTVEKNFQYLGFFQRTNSAIIFFAILILLFIFYIYFLYLSKKNKIKISYLKFLILFTIIILVFSYNAFSYDLFNYIFDAKIITFYHQNPYIHKALDFPNDPMLSFMRWTHRTYPYGPGWLLLTVPLSFVGSNIFLFTFFIFKTLNALFFVGSSYLIYKISEKIVPENKIFNTIFFALNPLIVIESLVSSHNDIPLVFFTLLSIYFILVKKKLYSLLSLAFSISIKFLSLVLIPIFGYIFYLEKKKKKVYWEKIFLVSLSFSLVSLALVTYRTTFQPWYLVFPISLASIISYKSYVSVPIIISSMFATSIYIPYVLLTDYAASYPKIINNLELLGLIFSLVSFAYYFLKPKLTNH